MARFAAGARQAIVRALTVGGLIAAGWLLAVLFGLLWASPAAADSTAATGASQSQETGDLATATDNAEAMAGRGVDGLTSQSKPTLPADSTADHSSGAHGVVPQSGGGSGQFGPGVGDVSRSVFDPRLLLLPAPLALVLPPAVRTAADEPSFSPD
ncbi:hypothetical protein [Streptosporangium sp. KLBMP 9127]|nr:hypothetical protein [Streptosporangium sp. KLBMP 9127]